MIRLHLCQILFNPAYHDNTFDLLEEPAPIPAGTTTTLGQLRRLDNVASTLMELRGSYIEHVTKKIENILEWSKSRHANIVVFPEYAVPVDSLPYLCKVASGSGILIVAGTHRVRLTESTRRIYESIGLIISEHYNGAAISPLIFPDGKISFAPKQSKSKWEPSLNVNVRTDVYVQTVNFEKTELTFAVAPCIDSLQMVTLAPFWADKAMRPSVLICPSHSPPSDSFGAVGKLMAANETLMAVCNSAYFGGTSFNIPEEWGQYIRGLPYQNRIVPPHSEAVLELDVNPEAFHLKKGSVITEPPCHSPSEFLVVYRRNNPWLEKYQSIKAEVLELLSSNSVPDAIEWIDSSLSEQTAVYPQAIVSKLKDVRHGRLVLYSGGITSVDDALQLVIISDGVESSADLFSARIEKALRLTTDLLLTASEENEVQTVMDVIKTLKVEQVFYGAPTKRIPGVAVDVPVKTRLSEYRYVPSDSILASFQNRGDELNKLRDIVTRATEKVILVTGMSGIGKTELIKALFLKILADWTMVWVNVPRGSSVARLVSEIGARVGIVMDPDSLATVTETIFRHKLSKIFDSLFSLQRYALIVDDLMDLSRSTRDYHQLQAIIEEASKLKAFKGSRLFLLSSASAAPLWLQRAGVARIPLQGLDDKHIRRTIEFQLRMSTTLAGEEEPDIPQKIFDIVKGHPLAAKIVAEAGKKIGMAAVDTSEVTSPVLPKLLECMLPKVELSDEELRALELLSVFRLPVNKELITAIIADRLLDSLSRKAIVVYDGHSYYMHPVIGAFYLKGVNPDAQKALHKTAVAYYDSIGRRARMQYTYGDLLPETIHHLALAGETKRLGEIRASSYDELFSSARGLYAERSYDQSLSLFKCIAELRPSEPAVWAYIGRCYGRRQQWSDCDVAFDKAIKFAERLGQDTWWLHRDWAHIQLRYSRSKDDGHFKEGRRHLEDSKKAGGRNDPSVIGSEAFLLWKEGEITGATELFERALRIDPDHTYVLHTYSYLLCTLKDDKSLRRAEELRNHLDDLAGQMAPVFGQGFQSEEEDDF